jgi:hypothetical protein
MDDKEGWVYILTNEGMSGLVKVGYSMKDPAIRAEELYKDITGVPMPFEVAYKALVVNPYQIEQAVHTELDAKRVNPKREFFRCQPQEVIPLIKKHGTPKYEEPKIQKSEPDSQSFASKTIEGDEELQKSEPCAYEMDGGGHYQGELDHDRYPHGHGIRTFPDGAWYKGDFQHGKFHGHGAFTQPDGFKYVGEWINSARNGQGTETTPEGYKCIGKWKNGKKEDSYAQLFYPDGTKYYGGFKEGERHGSGTVTNPEGHQRSGRWENGKMVKWDDERSGFQYFLLFLVALTIIAWLSLYL